jgi:hypothetical protein
VVQDDGAKDRKQSDYGVALPPTLTKPFEKLKKSCFALPTPSRWAQFTSVDWFLLKNMTLANEALGYPNVAHWLRNDPHCVAMLVKRGYQM